MSSALTLMAVHAHPDDEASTTGGILAKYSDEGIRTVLVTCTNGEMGDGPDGTKPGERGHDEELIAASRRRELEASRRALGVRHPVCLGYRDSGMAGWPSNDARPTGRYRIHNTVTKIVTGQVLEWSVAVAGEQPVGHVWGYEITEIGPHESEVTLYCDWTAVADVRLRSQFPFVPPSMMRLSLENLERIVLPQGVRAIRPHAVTLVTP